MRRNRYYATFTVVLLLFATVIEAKTPDEPYKFFREVVGLNEEQISAIRSGKAVAKVVESRTPDEVFVFGAVYVESTPESYLKLASDLDALRELPSYLDIQSSGLDDMRPVGDAIQQGFAQARAWEQLHPFREWQVRSRSTPLVLPVVPLDRTRERMEPPDSPAALRRVSSPTRTRRSRPASYAIYVERRCI
jgi:hypothetical protein